MIPKFDLFKIFIKSIIIFFLSSVFAYLKVTKIIIYIEKPKQKKLNEKLKEINKWINICKKKILIRGILKSSTKPKITALITYYNSDKYIYTALRSVQNQLLADIEILIVDDGSKNESLSFIKKLPEEDERIKIIENKRNRGALYSKSIGILKASGKYIMILDSDDLFANENIFNICLHEALQNELDIIEFSGFQLNSDYFKLNTIPKIPLYLRYKKHNEFVSQPQLSSYIYRKKGKNKYKLIDGYLCGKCVNSITFKLTLNIIGSDIYEQKMNYGDDRLINFILFKVANSFKYIKEYGIIYYYNKKSITHIKKYINNCHDELMNIMSIYNHTKNTEESDIAAFEVIHRWNKIIFPGLNFINFIYLKQLIDLLLSNNYIGSENKRKIISFSNKMAKSKRIKLFNLHQF